jgi:hypothetical protein
MEADGGVSRGRSLHSIRVEKLRLAHRTTRRFVRLGVQHFSPFNEKKKGCPDQIVGGSVANRGREEGDIAQHCWDHPVKVDHAVPTQLGTMACARAALRSNLPT